MMFKMFHGIIGSMREQSIFWGDIFQNEMITNKEE